MRLSAPILFCSLLAAPAFCQVSARNPALLYDAQLDFLYLSAAAVSPAPVTGDSSTSGSTNSSEGAQASKTSSSLGVRKAAFGFEWRLPRSVSLFVGLRPDADPRAGIREIDTRAGRSVEESPTIKNLDIYRIAYQTDSASISMGVEDQVVKSDRLGGEDLDFGLRPRGPQKAFALSCEAPKLVKLAEDTHVGIVIKALGGRDERVDGRQRADGGIGESPSKRDPYWGGAFQGALNAGDNFRSGAAFAFLEERQNGIKVRNSFYQLGLVRSIDVDSTRQLSISAEARQLAQVFELEGVSISPQTVSSVGFTAMYGRRSGEGVFWGFSTGNGNVHPDGGLSRSYLSKGHQLAGGWQWVMEDVLKVNATIAREWRTDHDSGGNAIGGFSTNDGQRSAITRFALAVGYLVAGQL